METTIETIYIIIDTTSYNWGLADTTRDYKGLYRDYRGY